MKAHLNEKIGSVSLPVYPVAPGFADADQSTLETVLKNGFPFQLDPAAITEQSSLQTKDAIEYVKSKLSQWGIKDPPADLPQVAKELFASLAEGQADKVINLEIVVRMLNLTQSQVLKISFGFKDASGGSFDSGLSFPPFIAKLLEVTSLGITLAFSE